MPLLVSLLSQPNLASFSVVTPSLLSNLSSRGGRLQGPSAALDFAPNQVGGMKLVALQVKSIQSELLPSPTPDHFRRASQAALSVLTHFFGSLGPLSTTGAWHRMELKLVERGRGLPPCSALWPRPPVVRGQEEIRTHNWNTEFKTKLCLLLIV